MERDSRAVKEVKLTTGLTRCSVIKTSAGFLYRVRSCSGIIEGYVSPQGFVSLSETNDIHQAVMIVGISEYSNGVYTIVLPDSKITMVSDRICQEDPRART